MTDTALHKLSDLLFDVRQKMTDQEWISINDILKTVATPRFASVKGLMESYGLEEGIASYIVSCLEDKDYSKYFCFVGEVIPAHLIFPDTSSDEEWSPARSHPMVTRSSARLA